MSNVQRIHLGPENAPIQQGRSAHGRWRLAYRQAAAPDDTGAPVPAVLVVIQDSDRLAFALAEGPAAGFLGEQLADYLWMRETPNGDWPLTLREWLADTGRWTDAPSGRTGFIAGRLDRNVAGGRIHLAWLGMSNVRLVDRSAAEVTLDTVIGEEEGWTPENGPEPVGMALHAYRGSLFGLERLMALSTGAGPLVRDLQDIANPDLEQALEDWGSEAGRDLAFFDLRLNPVLTEPNSVIVSYRWVSPDLCLLAWQPSPNATGYRIEESATPDFDPATPLAELTDGRQVQYRLSPPASSIRYYRVTPLNQGVPGTASDPVCPTPITLMAPILAPVEWASDGGYYLHWTPVVQATSYEIQSSPSADFEPHDSEIVYRGELAETHLPPEIAPMLYYRVHAINVLYAPHTPSPWSQPVRAPARLETPTFTRVSQQRLEWTPVSGARQYAIRVTPKGQDEQQGEEVFTTETACGVATQAAIYRVRALRRADDPRTASEWSDPVTMSPPEERSGLRGIDTKVLVPLLVGAVIVALIMGLGLGFMGLEAYQDAHATATRTPVPQALAAATVDAATASSDNATGIARLQTAARVTSMYISNQTATAIHWTPTPSSTHTPIPTGTPNLTETIESAFAAGLTATAGQWTATPSPTHTVTPSITPNLTETIESAFAAGLTATAGQWTATPSPTHTVTPSITPNLTETIEAAFAAGLTATASQWTATPSPTHTVTPSITPNLTETIEAAFAAGLTATAGQWTATPTPTRTVTPSITPNLTETIDAAFAAGLTATAAAWTPTLTPSLTPAPTGTPVPTDTLAPSPTLNHEATVAAYLSAGCYVINLRGATIPLTSGPYPGDRVLMDSVPLLAEVTGRVELGGAVWLRVTVYATYPMTRGWIRVPDGINERDLIGGHDCPAS